MLLITATGWFRGCLIILPGSATVTDVAVRNPRFSPPSPLRRSCCPPDTRTACPAGGQLHRLVTRWVNWPLVETHSALLLSLQCAHGLLQLVRNRPFSGLVCLFHLSFDLVREYRLQRVGTASTSPSANPHARGCSTSKPIPTFSTAPKASDCSHLPSPVILCSCHPGQPHNTHVCVMQCAS